MTHDEKKTLYAMVMKEIARFFTIHLNENKNTHTIFYHSYDGEPDLDADMIWLSTDKEFSKEFGENTDAYYLNAKTPYITDEDGILRDSEGNDINYQGEPASIGYFDAIDEIYQIWFMDNFDCVMTPSGDFTIVFDKNVLVPVKKI